MKDLKTKRIKTVFLALCLLITALNIAGCGKKNKEETAKTEASTETSIEENSVSSQEDSDTPSNEQKNDNAETEAGAEAPMEYEEPQTAAEIKEIKLVEDEFMKEAEVKEISDYHDFQNELGFRLRARIFAGESVLHILNGNVACCQFTLLSSAGETVVCKLKATKDAKTAEVMSGVDDPDMKKPSVSEFVSSEGRHIELSSAYSKKYGCDVWSWTKDDIYYTVTSSDNADPGVIAQMMEQCIQATNQND